MSVAVLISGRGSNMQALLDAGLPITTVISNEAEAKGLETAAAREWRPGSSSIAVFRAGKHSTPRSPARSTALHRN